MPQPTLAGKKRAQFRIKADKGSEVYVAGTFNGWNPRKNRMKYADGAYRTSVLLAKGKHEYKFIVDGVWCVDPECPEWTPNGLGSLNSIMNIG